MITVLATREGLVGKTTASGYVIDRLVPFVALPSRAALFRAVRIINPANGAACVAIVLDIGPWFIKDDAYVFQGERPKAESPAARSQRKSNGAGIDLSERVWATLGMTDNAPVSWEFIDPLKWP